MLPVTAEREAIERLYSITGDEIKRTNCTKGAQGEGCTAPVKSSSAPSEQPAVAQQTSTGYQTVGVIPTRRPLSRRMVYGVCPSTLTG